MAKRIKKPSVTQEQALDWLKRSDLGESQIQIAKKDSYDVRTVRVHLQKAKQERERNEARAAVLRGALEDHYKDLCNYALKLNPTQSILVPSLPAGDDIMEAALRQHLPRSPIWNLKTKRDRLEPERTGLLQKTRDEIQKLISGNPRIQGLETEIPLAVSGTADFFISQIELRSQQDIERKISDYLQVVPDGSGFHLQLGFSRLGFFEKRVDAERCMNVLRPLIDDLEENMKTSGAFVDLRDVERELARIEKKLRDEISIIRMRRIIPGRCSFCPL